MRMPMSRSVITGGHVSSRLEALRVVRHLMLQRAQCSLTASQWSAHFAHQSTSWPVACRLLATNPIRPQCVRQGLEGPAPNMRRHRFATFAVLFLLCTDARSHSAVVLRACRCRVSQMHCLSCSSATQPADGPTLRCLCLLSISSARWAARRGPHHTPAPLASRLTPNKNP
jgi:hypothetical protein